MHTLAFLCTGIAPVGDELNRIRALHILFLLAGLAAAFLAFRVARAKISNKLPRLLTEGLIVLMSLAGVGLLLFRYAISTCGS